jgi:8-oxo-dGTP diphosphatase
MGKTLATFVALHELPEAHPDTVARARFAVTLARSPAGIVLVFSRYREVWELPGGLIDPGESARVAAARELLEESGCQAGSLRWLGLVEVDDGRRHFGGVFACELATVPTRFESEETGGLAAWDPRQPVDPLGQTDRALLNRFG